MNDLICVFDNFISSFSDLSDHFYEVLFAAFFGTLFAFIFNWAKEYFDKKRQQTSNLIEIKYYLEKYLLAIRQMQKDYRAIRNEQLLVPSNAVFDSFNRFLIRSLKYGFYHPLDLLPIIDINKISFLTKNNQQLLDQILAASYQFNGAIRAMKERNERLINIVLSGEMTIGEWIDIIDSAEHEIMPYTLKVLNTLWHAREDCKKAIREVTVHL